MPHEINDESKDNSQRDATFWAWHPVGRGIGTGVLCSAFSETTPHFSTGFIYGALSGLTNVALRPLVSKSVDNISSPEGKALAYSGLRVLPWLSSAGIMQQLYKHSGNTLFKMNPRTAIGTAAAIEFFGYANRDLLSPGKK